MMNQWKVQGVGRLDVLFPSQEGPFILTFYRERFVKGLASNRFALRAMDNAGHKFEGFIGTISVSDGRLNFRAAGRLYKQFAYSLTRKYVSEARLEVAEGIDDSGSTDGESIVHEESNAAALSPNRVTSSVTMITDINDFHVMTGHLNARLLKTSAGKSSIKLTGRRRTCTSYSIARGIRHPAVSKIAICSDHGLGSVGSSADLVAPKKIESITGKRYALIMRGNFSRFTWAYPMRLKSDVPRAFE